MPIRFPEGFTEVTDDNYVIKGEDYYNYSHWGENSKAESVNEYFRLIIGRTFLKMKQNTANDNQKIIREGSFTIYTKGEAKPRFICKKKFPFGY